MDTVLRDNIREDLDHFYAFIRQHGYVIDTRSERPTLIKGLYAETFDTQEAAIMHAFRKIKRER